MIAYICTVVNIIIQPIHIQNCQYQLNVESCSLRVLVSTKMAKFYLNRSNVRQSRNRFFLSERIESFIEKSILKQHQCISIHWTYFQEPLIAFILSNRDFIINTESLDISNATTGCSRNHIIIPCAILLNIMLIRFGSNFIWSRTKLKYKLSNTIRAN